MEKTTAKSKFKTIDLVYIAISAALIAVCSWISITVGNVPFTLQTFAVCFVLGLLGGKLGTISILIYILLGAVGVPVFANFKGGIASLIGPTGGYIVGFILMGLLFWLGERLLGGKLWVRIVSLLAGSIVLYIFGTAWFMIVYTSDSPISLMTALEWCVIPFIIPDLCKLALGVFLSDRVKKILHI